VIDEVAFAQAEREAADWAEKLDGFADVTQDTLREFDRWRRLSSINRQAYDTLARDNRLQWVADRLHRLEGKITVIGETLIVLVAAAFGLSIFVAAFFLPRSPWGVWAQVGLGAFIGLMAATSAYGYLIRKFRA
jgi:ferric-dicitrate binding protein FerR (iron transport regulator)